MTLLEDNLANWNKIISDLEVIINQRQLAAFKPAYRSGCKCFDILRQHIENHDRQELINLQKDISETMNRWKKVSEQLKPWMAELKQQLEAAKSKNKQQKKIGKLFTYNNKSGKKLNVKAR